MSATAVARVPAQTPEHVNEAIRRRTRDSIAAYGSAGAEAIDQRLRELDHEWDIERVLETNAASVSLAGLALAATVDRRWLALPAAVAAFLLQRAVQGWCPPIEWFRRMGVRSAQEIAHERYALKLLRGDFRAFTQTADTTSADQAERALEAVEK